MSPREMIESVDELLAQVNALTSTCADESARAARQWEGLRQAGGQRDDHAAALLRDLGKSLDRLAAFAKRCAAQIAKADADPFGRRAQADQAEAPADLLRPLLARWEQFGRTLADAGVIALPERLLGATVGALDATAV